MVNCKPEWFKGVKMINNPETRICPDMDRIKKSDWVVKGSYEEQANRTSFSTFIQICSEGPNCKNQTETKQFLKMFYFTEYLVQRKSNIVNRKMDPIILVNTFQQQFMLDNEYYIDNNNFIEIETVTLKTSRFFFLE